MVAYLVLGSGFLVFAVCLYAAVRNAKAAAFMYGIFAALLTVLSVFISEIDGLRSFAPQLTSGEEATVLAVIPAAESPVVRRGSVIIYSEVHKDCRYVLVMKNNKGQERREFWSKPDSIRVGYRIGRLKSSGLILVKEASTGTTELAAR